MVFYRITSYDYIPYDTLNDKMRQKWEKNGMPLQWCANRHECWGEDTEEVYTRIGDMLDREDDDLDKSFEVILSESFTEREIDDVAGFVTKLYPERVEIREIDIPIFKGTEIAYSKVLMDKWNGFQAHVRKETGFPFDLWGYYDIANLLFKTESGEVVMPQGEYDLWRDDTMDINGETVRIRNMNWWSLLNRKNYSQTYPCVRPKNENEQNVAKVDDADQEEGGGE